MPRWTLSLALLLSLVMTTPSSAQALRKQLEGLPHGHPQKLLVAVYLYYMVEQWCTAQLPLNKEYKQGQNQLAGAAKRLESLITKQEAEEAWTVAADIVHAEALPNKPADACAVWHVGVLNAFVTGIFEPKIPPQPWQPKKDF